MCSGHPKTCKFIKIWNLKILKISILSSSKEGSKNGENKSKIFVRLSHSNWPVNIISNGFATNHFWAFRRSIVPTLIDLLNFPLNTVKHI